MPEVMEALNDHLVFINRQLKHAEERRDKHEKNSTLWIFSDAQTSYWKGQVEGISASIRIINSLEEKDA